MSHHLEFDTPGAALAYQARIRGLAEALVFPETGARVTFSEWHEQADQLARALLDLGLRPGAHIALLAENRPEWPLAQIGVARMGGVFVPLNTHYRTDDLRYALAQSRSEALIVSESFRSNRYLEMVRGLRGGLPDLRLVIVLGAAGEEEHNFEMLLRRGSKTRIALPQVGPDDLASLQYTSGTTGFAKGALLTHRGMLQNAWEVAERLGIRAGDRWTSIIPLFHCAGCIMNVLGCLQRGATYVGVPAFDPELMFRVIEGERCTALSGVPTSYLAMLQHPSRSRYDLSSLRTGTCGGADCNPDILRRCAKEFPQPLLAQVYGQTESSTLISCPTENDPDRLETAGLPLPGYEVRITDPNTGEPLPIGMIGQIEARGPMVMRGYFDKPEATADVIGPDGWLRTGDLGSLRSSGHLVIAGGRLRDMIIRGGENIYPIEIENVLMSHSAVADVAVFGVPDDYYGEIVAAVVKLDGTATSADLAAFCAERIARFKVPALFFRVESFPQTASGKIRKQALRELHSQGALEPLP
ncbi:AMP-binding protein [Rhodoligotrophos defluvii]|uniref:AMP-binding protein n=1 Tax=Rhodoligotrophos defluvii TaxID=2561934 RepID=UPI001EEFCE26|nr:AMP-binding protein [Rhodoligotrophos defluvii]